jgi:radical SAM protein with 4Fe4S-binding SPASM domain
MSTSVVTNGSRVNEKVAAELAGCNVFTILSVDGAKKETHERIRGQGAWEFVTSAVSEMHRAGVRFSTVMAVNKFNLAEVSGYLSLAKELGAMAGCLIPVMPTGRASSEIILNPSEMVTVLEDVQEEAERLKFWVSLWCTPFAELVVKSKRVFADFCRTSSQEIDIDPQGNVLLCDVLDIALSNVRSKKVQQAWREQENHPLVKSLSAPKTLPHPCLDCPLRKKCRGGCFARSELMAGSIYAPDPLCPRVAGVL